MQHGVCFSVWMDQKRQTSLHGGIADPGIIVFDEERDHRTCFEEKRETVERINGVNHRSGRIGFAIKVDPCSVRGKME